MLHVIGTMIGVDGNVFVYVQGQVVLQIMSRMPFLASGGRISPEQSGRKSDSGVECSPRARERMLPDIHITTSSNITS